MSRPCAADQACREFDRQTATPAQATNTALCEACLRTGERAAGQLVYDYRDLEQLLPRGIGQELDGQPGRSDEAQIPIRTDVEALQRAIWWVTTAWAEVLADRHGLSDLSKRTRDGWAVTWACRIIAPRITALARIGVQELADYPLLDEQEAIRHRNVTVTGLTGAQGVLDMAWLHDRARSMLGLTKLVRKLPGYCRCASLQGICRCNRPALEQANGSDTVRCAMCGHTQTRDEYERYANVFLRGPM